MKPICDLPPLPSCPLEQDIECLFKHELATHLVASRALTQLAGGVLKWAAEGRDFPSGVLDLTVREIVVAYDLMREQTDTSTADVWRKAIAGFTADTTYTSRQTLESGKSLTNYGIYAAVGEWLRYTVRLADERDWIERYLTFEMPLFTEFGMYRDPSDPMLYDLTVRQSLSELLHSGYDGKLRARIEELLRRAGYVTLLMLSPCGWAPFGGRSNSLLHNEAMVAYICEFQARGWRDHGRNDIASAFKEAARRAALAVEGYARQDPMRFIKNAFPPATRHGKDATYGEYANYALLAASLFARTALVADDTIPAAVTPPASHGCVLNLWPAFHKVFATCGDTHIEIDTRCQARYDATGLGRFQRKNTPPELALSMGIAANPGYIVHDAVTGHAAAIGPCWQTCAGEWQSLAQMSPEIEDVTFTKKSISSEAVEWEIAWSFISDTQLPVRSITQNFRLTQGRLDIETSVQGIIKRFGFEVPCFLTAGADKAEIEIARNSATVKYKKWTFRAEVPDASGCELEKEIRANRNALYRLAKFSMESPVIKLRLFIYHDDPVAP